ncbi:MAG: gamma-glutamyl-gamma-aminobutyrate hydrolase family protein [Bacteroidota bacterium]|nr:gamma-glutamyl-gamma-aminobutyrate hydrolase family protein [Bacteroidota bacterium]
MSSRKSIECFMHVPFEGPGAIGDWIGEKRHSLHYTRFFEGDALPDASAVEMLVIMGGPMDVFDFHVHPWMEDEIEWVKDFITSGKPVLGICLGAQIIAAALGEEVYPGEHKEIGWYNLRFFPSLGDYKICSDLPVTRKVFHWHGDTFNIPEGATRIAGSQAFPNQGFIYANHVVALQFHLEVTPESVKELVVNCRDELVEGPYIQSEKEILSEKSTFEANHQVLFRFLAYLCSLVS